MSDNVVNFIERMKKAGKAKQAQERAPAKTITDEGLRLMAAFLRIRDPAQRLALIEGLEKLVGLSR